MARRRRSVGRGAAFAAALLIARGATVHAQAPSAGACEPAPARITRAAHDRATPLRWPPPLDRALTFGAGVVSLREALDQVAAGGAVRLSYSPELVPLDRRVCLTFHDAPLGEVLLAILDGAGIAPIVVGADQIVLAPSRTAVAAVAMPEVARETTRLERVVVTGSATGGAERSSPFALSVLDRRDLRPASRQALAAALDGVVPGLWIWAQSPASPVARYGSVRGASSFGVSTPKVYIDGIEVANPLMVTQLDPASIERIEVIRGPQGAALYGADAISGVIQIVTRHDGADGDAPATELRASAGSSTSAFVDRGILTQEHGLSLRRGSAARSASLAVSLAALGAYAPGADARQVTATGSLRRVGSRLIVTGTARLHASDAALPASPVLAGLFPAAADSMPQRARHYTLGGSGTFQPSESWTHALTIGVDGYRLSGVSAGGMPLPSPTDSALRAARGGADRASVRYSTTRRIGAPETDGILLSVGAEHSSAREQSSGMGLHLALRGDGTVDDDAERESDDAARPGVTWWHNSGVLAQARAAVRGSLFLTGGARVERLVGPAAGSQLELLPLMGVSWAADRGDATVKLRAAYGRGIRPARTVARGGTWMGGHESRTLTALAAEEQAGTELGLDATWGERATLSVTRFDQLASGLVQPVAQLDYGSSGPGPGGTSSPPRVRYQLQNVGAIDNQGWEIQARTAVGPVAVGAAVTLVGSRVARLATGYLGDLREGDRMLEVPARTIGLTAGWASARWALHGALARASDWVNYDKLALAKAIAADSTGLLVPVGPALRAYWRDYEGVTHLSLAATYTLRRNTSLTVAGDNLLNRQLGEPDNVTVVPGRTINLGLRTAF